MTFEHGGPPGPGRGRAKELPHPLAERLRTLHAADDPRLNATLALLKQLAWPTISMARALGMQHSTIASRLMTSAARDHLCPLDDPTHPLAGLSAHLLPPWSLTQAEVDRLRALTVTAENATRTKHGSKERRASLELNELMQRLNDRGVTPAHLSRASGMPRHLVVSRLKRLSDLHDSGAAPWGQHPAGSPENVRLTDVQRRNDPSTTIRATPSARNRTRTRNKGETR